MAEQLGLYLLPILNPCTKLIFLLLSGRAPLSPALNTLWKNSRKKIKRKRFVIVPLGIFSGRRLGII